MKRFVFEAETFNDYNNWAIFDIQTFKKIKELLKDIKRDPFKGLGKPEPLKHELAYDLFSYFPLFPIKHSVSFCN